MRAADLAFFVVAVPLVVLLTVGAEACRDYRECMRGGVVLPEGPSRVAAPSRDRCLAYVLR